MAIKEFRHRYHGLTFELIILKVSSPVRNMTISLGFFTGVRLDPTDEVDVNLGDNFKSFPSRTEPSNHIAGRNTVLHENCLVPGNIASLKKLLLHNSHTFEDERDPIAKLARQNRLTTTITNMTSTVRASCLPRI